MARLLAIVLCLCLALVGVSGMHFHVPGELGEPSHERLNHHADTLMPAAAMWALDHEEGHAHRGDRDVKYALSVLGSDSGTKIMLVLAGLFFVFAVELPTIVRTRIFVGRRLERPPKVRHTYAPGPPSHAPPF